MYIGFYTQEEIVAIGEDDAGIVENNAFVHKQQLKDLSKVIFHHNSEQFEIKLTRDGLFALQLKEVEREFPQSKEVKDFDGDKSREKWRLYVDHINAFQVALMTSSLNVVFKSNLAGIHDITRDDVLTLNAKMHAEGLWSSGNTVATRIYRDAPLHALTASKFLCIEHFNLCIDIFSEVLLNGSITHVANMGRSLVHYKTGNNNLALAIAWFEIESLLKRRLRGYIQSPENNYIVNKDTGAKRFNKSRCDYLADSTEVALVAELLELLGLIDFETYKEVSVCRKHRNGMVHGSISVVKTEVARRCIKLLVNLINLEFNSSLKICTNQSMTLI
ncbi:hypothetical protein [Shewanella sp. MBTL60-007]|uniref:hypothetical protein n=1 Tax=Shewanella sp. MBTL60-007 TaxID=2815911 RepID=UPI001BBF8EB5|nr:hypothetical protein [Shewanella sp. MBTL60-007]GIU13649.1 hypothetical protein TUM3792_03580 [Shewanella sp. MBTL60-007]